ncbi:vanillate O-demethylase ferredoxin subunit [Paraburkholderia sp. RAU2J]|uniref:PDR/VanB family oxidoreductase n=1 Tax=Paraburkholderia sp. RAU2J TaxID=1938810 RepID=UPI000EB2061A|nr:PDR/VanB family oxidoreductase [Paraburkholderia sp. RAU2J]RKT22861.1 vanillate O-demethylase ferredoxin subunit [Paraburkholderia sp. RAU2J]
MTTATLTVIVSRKWQEAQDICGFEFISEDGSPLLPFSAGSHVDVHLPGGLIRQYSLCNNPDKTNHYQIAVLRDANGRGGSAAIHDLVKEGDRIKISEPKNHFPLAHNAPHHLLLAGGIGITPILCMAERLTAIGDEFEMHYCSRTPERMAFTSRIQASPFNDKVAFHFDTGDQAQKFDIEATLANTQAGTHLYVCGPRGFMDAVLDAARRQKWEEARLHYEFFGAVIERPASDTTFKVRLASSGVTLDVPPECTVIEVLAASGIEVPTSCEQGVCGTCLTRVIDGEPDHRDSYLTDDERATGDQFLPCCSRAKTPYLVLDL